MSTRNRNRPWEPAAEPGATPESAGGRERWEDARRLAAEADDAIDQCLSEDSEEHNRSKGQRGGE
jgi:hypothetical protein